MKAEGSTEFSTWVALAVGAIAVAVCATFSSSLFVLIPAGLIGAYLGYKAEHILRFYINRALSKRRSG